MTWHTVKEAAPRIGLNEDAVYALIASKRLGHRRVGVAKGRGKISISDAHIADFLASCEVPVVMEHRPPTKGSGRPARAQVKSASGATLRPDGKPMEFF